MIQDTSVTFVGGDERLIMTFADGQHEIPSYIVQFFGMEELKNLEDSMKLVTWDQFYSGYRKVVEKKRLNDLGDTILQQHFARRF